MTREFLHRYSHHSATSWGAGRKARHMSRLLRHLRIPPGGTILEIGTGRGEFALEAVRAGYRYLGVEPSEALRAPLARLNLSISPAAVPPLPVEDESVDVVHSTDVFEHFVGWEVAMEVCREALRALKPGGLLSIVAPNYDTTRRLFWAYEYQHTFVTTRGRLAALVRDAGFSGVQGRPFLTTLGLGRLRVLDRLLCHLLLPPFRSSAICDLLQAAGLEHLLFRAHKVLCDHVLVVGFKPSDRGAPA